MRPRDLPTPLGIHAHGSELGDSVHAPIFADSPLPEQDRPPVVEPDEDGHEGPKKSRRQEQGPVGENENFRSEGALVRGAFAEMFKVSTYK